MTVIGTVSEYVVTYGNEKYHSQRILAVLKRPKLFYNKTTERKLLIKNVLDMDHRLYMYTCRASQILCVQI